jgi:hypothetical protein
MNKVHQSVVFGFTPHRVKPIVAAMAFLPTGLPAVVSKEENPDTTEQATTTAPPQSNVDSEEKMDISQRKMKLSGAWSVDVLLRT